MIDELELREEIARTANADASLDDLYRFVMERSWNMHTDSAPKAQELAADVEAIFFEREGDSDDVILEKLRALIR